MAAQPCARFQHSDAASHEGDKHLHGLHGDVPDVGDHVRGDGRQSNDEAVRRVFLYDCEGNEGRKAGSATCDKARGQRTLPPARSQETRSRLRAGFSRIKEIE